MTSDGDDDAPATAEDYAAVLARLRSHEIRVAAGGPDGRWLRIDWPAGMEPAVRERLWQYLEPFGPGLAEALVAEEQAAAVRETQRLTGGAP